MIAQELEVSLHMAFVDARQKRHEFITVEHLLLALMDNPSAADVLRARREAKLFGRLRRPRSQPQRNPETRPVTPAPAATGLDEAASPSFEGTSARIFSSSSRRA